MLHATEKIRSNRTTFIGRKKLPTYCTTSTNNHDKTIHPQTISRVYTGAVEYSRKYREKHSSCTFFTEGRSRVLHVLSS